MTIFNHYFQSGILLVILLTGFSQARADSSLPAEKQRLTVLRAKINKTRHQIRDMESTESTANHELEIIERDYAKSTKNLDVLTSQRQELEEKLRTIARLKTKQENSLVEKRNHLENQVREAYLSGRQHQWRLFLGQSDPSKIARHMVYYSRLNEQRLSQIESVTELLSDIKSLETNTLSVNKSLTKKFQEIENEQSLLKKTKQKRTVLLANLRTKINQQKSSLSLLVKNAQKLERLIKEISRSIDDLDLAVINKQPFPKLKGKLPWPVQRFSSYKRRITNNQAQGLTIKTREGTQVHAVAKGRIVFSDWMPGYGLLIIIDHGSNYLSLYANNQSLKTSLGSSVNAGEVIASAGSSGGKSVPALYFEIRNRKRQQNPLRWLTKQGKN